MAQWYTLAKTVSNVGTFSLRPLTKKGNRGVGKVNEDYNLTYSDSHKKKPRTLCLILDTITYGTHVPWDGTVYWCTHRDHKYPHNTTNHPGSHHLGTPFIAHLAETFFDLYHIWLCEGVVEICQSSVYYVQAVHLASRVTYASRRRRVPSRFSSGPHAAFNL